MAFPYGFGRGLAPSLAPAPDFWRLNPFYVGQQTASGCSVERRDAVNALRGLPAGAREPIVTQPVLLAAIGDKAGQRTSPALLLLLFASLAARSLAAFGLTNHGAEVIRPAANVPPSFDPTAGLAANEASERDVILVYFNQGVLTGDWDGPPISPIGTYDEARRQVLIMDVDRERYMPYWTADTTILAAIAPRPAPAHHGVLVGETGALIWIPTAYGGIASMAIARDSFTQAIPSKRRQPGSSNSSPIICFPVERPRRPRLASHTQLA